MQHVHFSMASDGFAGHLAEPEGGTAVFAGSEAHPAYQHLRAVICAG